MTSSLKLSKQLYELSGWKTSEDNEWIDDCWVRYSNGREGVINIQWQLEFHPSDDEYWSELDIIAPAYDLGYLLRKLPTRSVIKHIKDNEREFYLAWLDPKPLLKDIYEADTPEDCAALLAIELFKQGVLK